MYLRPASILVCFIYVSIRVAQAYEEADKQDIEHAFRLLEQMSETRRGLSALREVLNDIDTDLQKTQKRACAVGGGMSHHCAAALLDDKLSSLDWIKSGYSPGKRALQSIPESDSGTSDQLERKRWGAGCSVGGGMPGYQCHLEGMRSDNKAKQWLSNSRLSPGKRDLSLMNRKVKDLTTKRKGLEVLKRLLTEMDADLKYEQKRTCSFNLGGHCATESAASVADQWHYLNSPLSPGRKRRDTRLYKRLVSGKMLLH